MKNKSNDFEKIWDEVVCPLIKETSNRLNLKQKNLSISRYFIGKIYDKEKNIFMNSYMVSSTNNIDRHKIASCLMKAILKIKPIKIPLNEKLQILFRKNKCGKNIFLANEFLSLSVATTIIQSYIKADKSESKKFKHPIIFPEPFPKHDDNYILDICLDLYYNNPSRFNTIAYANIFFLLEKYSCRKFQCDNLESEYKSLIIQSQNCSDEEAQKEVKEAKFKKIANF